MKAIKYFTCILLFTLTSRIYSQIPDTIWTKTFGGVLSDLGVSVKQTNDGGFIVAATTSSFGAGGQDIYLIKSDENGDTLWTKTFGGAGNDRAANVDQTNDNGYAIFGTTNSYGNGGDDFLLWKTDSLGNTEWFKTYGGITNEKANEGQQLSEGTYIIVGDSVGQNTYAWIIKTDENGNFIWGRTIGTPTSGYQFSGRSVQQTNDGGFAMSGLHVRPIFPGSSVLEYCFYKISSTGNLMFYRTYGSYLGVWSVIIRKLSDGNFILGGSVRDIYGGDPEKPWILKIDQYGNIIWDKVISISQNPAIVTSIDPTNDNGFAFTVYAAMGQNISLFKCDENGNLNWEKIIGGSGVDDAYSIQPTDDSGYIVTGRTNSFGAGDFDVWLLKFKYNPPPEITVTIPNGGEHWMMWDTVQVEWTATGVDSVKIELSLSDGIDWMTVAESVLNTGTFDWFVQTPFTSWYCLMKISDAGDSTIFDISDTTFTIDMFPSVEDSSGLFPDKFALMQNYPNPFNPVTSIQYAVNSRQFVMLKVYDVLGNEIATLVNEEKQPGIYQVEFSPESSIKYPASGIYFYQLKAGGFIETKKMVFMK
ncbi:MAG TPA: T9SS type A sorting domain-containing protein [Ignavibacteriaceae bacterium]|nr:T9SS type A sorting domain-containing protein [Ignavibacteriaceae bacterium]